MNLINQSILAIMSILLAMGCENIPFLTSQQEDVNLQVVEACDEELIKGLKDIPRLHVDMPEELHPWEKDVEILRDSIAAHNGRAMIGLKAPDSKRMRKNNNIREAVSAEQFEAGLHMLCNRDIKITNVYNSFGATSVRMEPDQVFDLFDHPRVDYIDFPMKYEIN